MIYSIKHFKGKVNFWASRLTLVCSSVGQSAAPESQARFLPEGLVAFFASAPD